MTNAVCLSYNDSVFIFHHCRLKAISRNKVVLNLNGTLPHPVDKISFHLKVFKRENGYKPWLIDSKTDICRFLKSNYDPVAKLVFNLFKEFSNFNHPCPFVVSFSYFKWIYILGTFLISGPAVCDGLLPEARIINSSLSERRLHADDKVVSKQQAYVRHKCQFYIHWGSSCLN